MYKPNSLRAHLTSAIADLEQNPNKLLVFVDEGNVVARAAGSHSFEYAYKLNIIITDYVGDEDALMLALLAWCHIHQLDLLANPDKSKTGIRFEADFNSTDSVDIDIKVDLTERVVVTETQPGRLDVTHKAEAARIGETIDPAKIWTAYDGEGKQLGRWQQPTYETK